jgi:hypothetical protein
MVRWQTEGVMTKHTPGPWAIREDHGYEEGHFDILDADENRVAQVCNEYADYDMAVANWHGEYGETMRANARLIAAAPELPEALQMWHSALRGKAMSEKEQAAYNATRVAIAKATNQ